MDRARSGSFLAPNRSRTMARMISSSGPPRFMPFTFLSSRDTVGTVSLRGHLPRSVESIRQTRDLLSLKGTETALPGRAEGFGDRPEHRSRVPERQLIAGGSPDQLPQGPQRGLAHQPSVHH